MLIAFSTAALLAGVPLIEAVKAGDTEAVRALVASRTDVNAPEVDGTTALHWAAHFDNLAAADLLIRAGANVKTANRYGITPLWLACINGSEAMVEKLLAAGADPNTTMREGDTALMTAARTGNVGAVKALLIAARSSMLVRTGRGRRRSCGRRPATTRQPSRH